MTQQVNHNNPPELSDNDAELLSAYIDNRLTDAEREALEVRLQTDAFLQTELAAMRRTVEWLNAMPLYKAPRNFTLTPDDIAGDAPAEQAPPAPDKIVRMPTQWRNLAIGSAAAILVVIVGVGVALQSGILSSVGGDTSEMAGAPQNVANLPTETTIAQQEELQVLDDAADVVDSESAELDTTSSRSGLAEPTATALSTQTAMPTQALMFSATQANTSDVSITATAFAEEALADDPTEMAQTVALPSPVPPSEADGDDAAESTLAMDAESANDNPTTDETSTNLFETTTVEEEAADEAESDLAVGGSLADTDDEVLGDTADDAIADTEVAESGDFEDAGMGQGGSAESDTTLAPQAAIARPTLPIAQVLQAIQDALAALVESLFR